MSNKIIGGYELESVTDKYYFSTGSDLKSYRRSLNLSQPEFGDKLGLTIARVRKLEESKVLKNTLRISELIALNELLAEKEK